MTYLTIETNFLTACKAVTGVASTNAKEPARIDALPSVSLYFIGCPQQPDTTGWDVVTWVWGVEIAVRMDDLVEAQKELQSILPGIMKTVRTDPQLGNSCNWAVLEDREEPPFRASDDKSFIKRIYLRAQTDEN